MSVPLESIFSLRLPVQEFVLEKSTWLINRTYKRALNKENNLDRLRSPFKVTSSRFFVPLFMAKN